MDLSNRTIASGATPDLTGVNLTGAKLFKTSLRDVTLSGANLTNVDLTHTFLNSRTRLDRANLTGAVSTGKDLTGVRLTGAKLVGADLNGANLTGVDASKADFTGAVLAGATLASANLSAAVLSRADLSRARLPKTDLTGADLSHAILTGANLITAKLTRAVWKDTVGPFGGKYSIVGSPFPTVPDGAYRAYWYMYRSVATDVLPSTPLLGTPGAPINTWGGGQESVQGSILNMSRQRILIRVRDFEGVSQEAILEPDESVPYRFENPTTVEFFKAPEGNAVGSAVKLRLIGAHVSPPSTQFFPPDWSQPANTRDGWEEGGTAKEIWGSTELWIKRGRDGWLIPLSDEYVKAMGIPNGTVYQGQSKPNDFTIFHIEVRDL